MKFKVLLALGALIMVTGCATSRSVVSLGTQPAYNNANPVEGTAVKITAVDARVFELKPSTPDIPSLKDGAIDNKDTTSRAIGRKRNGYGKALGDILLPEGQTVSNVVGGAVTNAFRQAGYRVLSPGDAGYDQAVPVDAQIKQYWSWVNMGFWTIKLSCRSEVLVTAPLPGLKAGLNVQSLAEKSTAAAFESDWQDIATEGLAKLTTDLASKLPRQTAAQ